jgi:hypothetical protein
MQVATLAACGAIGAQCWQAAPAVTRATSGCLSGGQWGITKLDALRDLFNGHAWKPPGLEPAG